MATYPGSKSYRKNDLFKNHETIYSFDDIVKRGKPEFLMLHVPEYASLDIFRKLKQKYSSYMAAVADLRVNIMHQNILLMQKPYEVANWFYFTPVVTQTTAHNKYTSQELADTYDLPTKHLSTFVDARQYAWVPYEKKKKRIALSPDINDTREQVVAKLAKELPDYEVITIQNMSYEHYKKFISETKYTITFGEGFDGYYVEGFFTGGVTFATYNGDFFPDEDFGTFDNTFSSGADMVKNIVTRIKAFDTDKKAYEKTVKTNLDKINELYNFNRYQNNIKEFYQGKFTFLPSPKSAERLIGEVLRSQDMQLAETASTIAHRDKTIADMEAVLVNKSTVIRELDDKISRLENSLSWKVTKPLRKVSGIMRRKN